MVYSSWSYKSEYWGGETRWTSAPQAVEASKWFLCTKDKRDIKKKESPYYKWQYQSKTKKVGETFYQHDMSW